MVVQHFVKRTLYVCECSCDKEDPWRRTTTDSPPRESQCPKCKQFHPWKEESASGPEYKTMLTENKRSGTQEDLERRVLNQKMNWTP